MKEEIFEELKTELTVTEGDKFNESLLRSKVNSAYRAVNTARKYPPSYTDAMIEHDMEKYYTQVREIALYDYNQIGAEGQTQFTQDGVTVHYLERDKLFYGVLPIASRG